MSFLRHRGFIFSVLVCGALAGSAAYFASRHDLSSNARDSGVSSLTGKPGVISPASRERGGGTRDHGADSVDQWGKAEWRKRLDSAKLPDYPALMRQAMEIKDAAVRAEIVGALSSKWINQDLRDFMTFVNAEDVDDKGTNKIWKVLLPAFEFALPSLNERAATMLELKDILHRLVVYAASEDPAAAVTWSRRWLQDDMLASALATASVELARQSPQEAFAVLATIDKPVRRVEALTGIATVLTTTDSTGAMAWADSLTDPAERPYAMGSVLNAMAEKEPARAAREFLAYSDKINREYASEARRAGAADGRDPARETESGVADPVGNDVEPDSPTTNPQLHLLAQSGISIAEHWAAVDPAAAMQWVEALPPGRMRRDALQSAFGSWAKVDPEAALAAYERSYASNSQVAEDIFRSWATRSPVTAATQAANIANGEQQSYAVAGAVSGWLGQTTDTAAVETWAGNLPTAKARDVAYAAITDAVVDSVPATAWKYACLIQDTDLRKAAMDSAFTSLAASNPSLARSTLLASNLPGDEADKMRSILNAVLPTAIP